MSQSIMGLGFNQTLLPVKNKPKNFEDSPCPVCGQICPNDAYCVNCGYIYDPLLKKYLKQETRGKKAKEKPNKIMENRNPDGSYIDLPSNNRSKQDELILKYSQEFRRQFGKAAKLGDIVRLKNIDGSYNGSSGWYIYTKSGWMKSPSKKRKPTEPQIKRVCQNQGDKKHSGTSKKRS